MLSIALIYARDAASIAEELQSEIKNGKNTWKATLYPTLSEEDITLWTAIKNGELNTDIIVFLSSEQFLNNAKSHLSNLVHTANTKYRYAGIVIGWNSSFPKMQVALDLEMVLEQTILQDSENWKKCISELCGYCKIVELANNNSDHIKKEKKEKHSKRMTSLFGIVSVYFGTIICAITLLQTESSGWTRSSAELVLFLVSATSVLLMCAGVYFLLTGIQKKREREEQALFENDLDVALSKSTQKPTTKGNSSVALDIISYTTPLLSHDLLDAIFSLFRSKESGRETTTDLSIPPVTSNTLPTIGDETYLPLGHLKVNWSQMKGYYDISKKQAALAFAFAIIICFIGIVIFVFAVASPLIPAFASNNVLIPIVGTIGGAIVELFAGTILIVYKKTLSQMNLYHKALSDYQRYLSCVNLVSMISNEEKRNLIYNQIIISEINKAPTIRGTDTSS